MGIETPLGIGKAASVLIIRDDPLSVLMVQRRDSGQYASAFVFPGGAVEASDFQPLNESDSPSDDETRHHLSGDDYAFSRAAIRETWEEVGLLIAAHRPPSVALESLDRSNSLDETVMQLGLGVNLDELHYFGHWVTPIDMPKRWDTRFLLTRAPDGQDPQIDGDEVTACEWITPQDALALHDSGDRSLLFPTYMNLRRLAESTSVDDAIERSASYPRIPALVTAQRTADGVWRQIPEAAGYGAERHWMPNLQHG